MGIDVALPIGPQWDIRQDQVELVGHNRFRLVMPWRQDIGHKVAISIRAVNEFCEHAITFE